MATATKQAEIVKRRRFGRRGGSYGDEFALILADRLEREDFNRTLADVKQAGGWYSGAKFGRHGRRGGFGFASHDDAQAFAARLGLDITEGKAEEGEEERPEQPKQREKKPERTPARKIDPNILRQRARNWAEQAAQKLQARPTHTPKKLSQARAAEVEGRRLARAAVYALHYADMIENGTLPAALKDLQPTKDRFVAIGSKKLMQTPNGFHPYSLETSTWADTSAEAKAMRAVIEDEPETEELERKEAELDLRRREDDLRFADIPGFFPTPPAVIEEMLRVVKVEEGNLILEPSAGKGDIAEAIRDRFGDSVLVMCCEWSSQLRPLLKQKGFELHAEPDFMALEHGPKFPGYDRIVMNPPFERGRDVTHVTKAYSLLAPGGKLVALMANGPHFQRFVPWLEEHDGLYKTLPAGSFHTVEAFRRTGVSVNLVLFEKGTDAC